MLFQAISNRVGFVAKMARSFYVMDGRTTVLEQKGSCKLKPNLQVFAGILTWNMFSLQAIIGEESVYVM